MNNSEKTDFSSIQGQGGIIKTRSQRLEENSKTKSLDSRKAASTIDIESTWQSMKSQIESKSPSQLQANTDKHILNTYSTKSALKATNEAHMAVTTKASNQSASLLNGQTNDSKSKSLKSKRVPKRRNPSLEDLVKKPKKMNTLEHSRLEWSKYVEAEGLKDELNHHNKDGYLQKQDFLSRVEHRLDKDWLSSKKKDN